MRGTDNFALNISFGEVVVAFLQWNHWSTGKLLLFYSLLPEEIS